MILNDIWVIVYKVGCYVYEVQKKFAVFVTLLPEHKLADGIRNNWYSQETV